MLHARASEAQPVAARSDRGGPPLATTVRHAHGRGNQAGLRMLATGTPSAALQPSRYETRQPPPPLERPIESVSKPEARQAPAERQADILGERMSSAAGFDSAIGSTRLADQTRRIAEQHLGVDLAGVELRADGAARARTAQAGAIAITEGNVIYIGARHHTLPRPWQRRLIGHELTHAAQQRRHGIAVPQAQHHCAANGTPEEQYANQNPGKVFAVNQSAPSDGPSNEFMLWNYCVGESRLRPGHTAQLGPAADRWKGMMVPGGSGKPANSDLRVKIVGTASASGAAKANEALSTKRAEAVKDFLVGRGVPAARIDIEATGSRQPLADETTPENMARNRRVDVFLFTATPIVQSLGPTVDVQVDRIATARSAQDNPETFDAKRNLYAIRALGGMRTDAAVRATSMVFPADVGFLQFLTHDVRRAQYNSTRDKNMLVLDYDRCTSPFLPCRDVLTATSLFTGDGPTNSLAVPGGQTKSGHIHTNDSPGIALPLRYPDPKAGDFELTHYFWLMDFTIVLGARSSGVFMPVQHTTWSVAASMDVDVAAKKSSGMAPVAIHRDWVNGAPLDLDMQTAMAGRTCRLATRSMEIAPEDLPCRPSETKG